MDPESDHASPLSLRRLLVTNLWVLTGMALFIACAYGAWRLWKFWG